MNNLIIFPNGIQNPEIYVLLSKAQEILDHKEKLTIVTCNPEIKSTCAYNIFGQSNICSLCKKNKKNLFSKLRGKFEILNFNNFENEDNEKSFRDIKNLDRIFRYKFMSVETGIAAYATYINLTRDSDMEGMLSYKIVNQLIRSSNSITKFFSRFLEGQNITSIFLFNGRFHNVRPFVDLSKKKKLNLTVYEFNAARNLKKNNNVFEYKSLFNDPKDYLKQANKLWKSKNIKTKLSVSKKFYTSKALGKTVDDIRSYVNEQKIGLLPKNWNEDNHNIVVFTSSDDEYKTGSLDYSKNFFPEQFETIKKISQMLINKKKYKIWVREHPNLKDVFWKYRSKIFELNLKNVEVIEARSPISTYSLMFASKKVITFSSITSVEALYWGKPSIILGRIPHENFEGFFTPKNFKELKTLLINKNLKSASNLGALKYALFRSLGGKKFKYLNGNETDGYSFKSLKISKPKEDFLYKLSKFLEIYYYNYFKNYLIKKFLFLKR